MRLQFRLRTIPIDQPDFNASIIADQLYFERLRMLLFCTEKKERSYPFKVYLNFLTGRHPVAIEPSVNTDRRKRHQSQRANKDSPTGWKHFEKTSQLHAQTLSGGNSKSNKMVTASSAGP